MAWWARGGVAGCTAGVSVVHFSPIRPHHRTGLLRLGSAVSAVAPNAAALRDPRRPLALPESQGTAPNHPALASRTLRGLYPAAVEFRVFFNPPRCQHAARRRLAHLASPRCARRAFRAWERGTRLPVSARRVHDAARERRIPWSVNLTSSLGCPDPRRSTGHSLLHPLQPPRWPNLDHGPKHCQPAPTTWCPPTRRSRAGVTSCKLSLCTAVRRKAVPCCWASGDDLAWLREVVI